MEFLVVKGDITNQVADALVNSVNSSLRLSDGVARNMREAAGHELEAALQQTAPKNPTGGSVFITDAFALQAEHVLHAVAVPLSTGATESTIRDATIGALETADEHGCTSIAMPALGTGISGFDIREGSRIICEEIHKYDPDFLEEALLVGYSAEGYETLRSVAWGVRGKSA